MQLNTQPIEKLSKRTDGLLEVHSIFHTIQGEGPFCGTPCVFVRLTGCNLQCPWCDTEYTSSRMELSPKDILRTVQALWNKGHSTAPAPGLVVITGGEPFRQQLAELFTALVDEGFYVQVESNGTLPPSPFEYNLVPSFRSGVYIVCSPKAGKVNPLLASEACCFKYVLESTSMHPDDGLPLQALGHTAHPYVARPPEGSPVPVYLQPMDAQDAYTNSQNVRAVKESCMKHGYIMQLQIHKLIGVE